jgi:hypothetical protein
MRLRELPFAPAHSLDEADRLLAPPISLACDRRDLALVLDQRLLGCGEPRPLLLQLPEQERLGHALGFGRADVDSGEKVFGLGGRRLDDGECRAGRGSHDRSRAFAGSVREGPFRIRSPRSDSIPYCVASALARSGLIRSRARRSSRRAAYPSPAAERGRARARRRSEDLVRRAGVQGDATQCGPLPHLDIGVAGPGDKGFLTRCLFRVRSCG